MRLFAAALVGGFLLSASPSQAQTCDPIESVLATFESINPGVTVVLSEKGQPAEMLVNLFNSAPPVSDLQADYVVIFGHPMTDAVYVIFSFQGCVVAHQTVPGQIWVEWQRRITAY